LSLPQEKNALREAGSAVTGATPSKAGGVRKWEAPLWRGFPSVV
jgi:hypothetical protein